MRYTDHLACRAIEQQADEGRHIRNIHLVITIQVGIVQIETGFRV